MAFGPTLSCHPSSRPDEQLPALSCARSTMSFTCLVQCICLWLCVLIGGSW